MIHRDDMDFEEAEELQQHFEEMFPGSKIVFMGDIPEDQLTDEDREIMKQIDDEAQASYENGTCIVCATEMENYDPTSKEWKSPEGWDLLHAIGDDDRVCWRCPACSEGFDDEEDDDSDEEEDDDGVWGDFE